MKSKFLSLIVLSAAFVMASCSTERTPTSSKSSTPASSQPAATSEPAGTSEALISSEPSSEPQATSEGIGVRTLWVRDAEWWNTYGPTMHVLWNVDEFEGGDQTALPEGAVEVTWNRNVKGADKNYNYLSVNIPEEAETFVLIRTYYDTDDLVYKQGNAWTVVVDVDDWTASAPMYDLSGTETNWGAASTGVWAAYDPSDVGVDTSEDTHAETPTEDGYYIVISGARYVKMTGGEPWDINPSYTQWAALNVHVEEGEHISFYHVESGSGAAWATMTIDPASKGTWTQEDNGILCGETNNYDMYVKLKFGQDNIYFGYAA